MLQDKLAELTGIPASNQIILYTDQDLKTVVDAMAPVRSYPKSILDTQLRLINTTAVDNTSLKLIHIRKLFSIALNSLLSSNPSLV